MYSFWTQLLAGCLLWAAATARVVGPSATALTADDGSVLYGGIVFAGGENADGKMDSVEEIGTFALPPIPQTMVGHTLNSIGSSLFMCGGLTEQGPIKDCFTLDTGKVAPQWEHYGELPQPMYDHTAVTSVSNIWITYNSTLFNFRADDGEISAQYPLPFYAHSGFCAVSNTDFSYVIGAGYYADEIWLNDDAFRPGTWTKVYTMENNRIHAGCLLLGHTIYITGGINGETSAEAFDTTTYEMRKIAYLNKGRHSHKMFMLDGKPAVAGGQNQDGYIRSIETYDLETMEWKTSARRLEYGRAGFAATEVYDKVASI